jgi:hypothetical protein
MMEPTLVVPQETEVMAKARRRRFTAAEKLRILRLADACTKLGAMLRREGIYSSSLLWSWDITKLLGPTKWVRNVPQGKTKPAALLDFSSKTAGFQWSGRQDLNLRPLAPQASALPGCATPRKQERR